MQHSRDLQVTGPPYTQRGSPSHFPRCPQSTLIGKVIHPTYIITFCRERVESRDWEAGPTGGWVEVQRIRGSIYVGSNFHGESVGVNIVSSLSISLSPSLKTKTPVESHLLTFFHFLQKPLATSLKTLRHSNKAYQPIDGCLFLSGKNISQVNLNIHPLVYFWLYNGFNFLVNMYT